MKNEYQKPEIVIEKFEFEEAICIGSITDDIPIVWGPDDGWN